MRNKHTKSPKGSTSPNEASNSDAQSRILKILYHIRLKMKGLVEMFFKRIEKKLDEIQKQPNDFEKQLSELKWQLDELRESLRKNSTVVDNLAQDRLKKAHTIMSYAINTSYSAVLGGLDIYSASYCVTKEMFKQLKTAQKLIGEVIGEGGADDE